MLGALTHAHHAHAVAGGAAIAAFARESYAVILNLQVQLALGLRHDYRGLLRLGVPGYIVKCFLNNTIEVNGFLGWYGDVAEVEIEIHANAGLTGELLDGPLDRLLQSEIVENRRA